MHLPPPVTAPTLISEPEWRVSYHQGALTDCHQLDSALKESLVEASLYISLLLVLTLSCLMQLQPRPGPLARSDTGEETD